MSTQQSRLEIVIDTSKAQPQLIQLRSVLSNVVSISNDTNKAVHNSEKAFKEAAKGAEAYKNVLKTVATYASSYFAGRELLNAAEAWTNINNRLKLVTSSTEEAADAQKAVLEIANSTRQPLQATADLYTRIAKNQKALSLTSKELASVTKTVAQTMVISGASAQAGEAALIQLGQALGSGVLRGDELNSIMEQAQGLADTIAKGMGVSIGELRKLGAEGKLTAQAVIEAIKSQEDAVNQAFSGMQATVSQEMNYLNNAFIEWVGNADQAHGASAALANTIHFVADNMDDIAKATAVAASALGTYKLVSAALSPTTLAVINSITTATKAMLGLQVATEGVTKAQMLLRLTPLGLALGAATGAFLLFANGGKVAKESLLDLSQPLDSISEKIKTLSVIQLDAEKIRLGNEYQEQLEKLEGAAEHFSYQVKLSTTEGTISALDALNELSYNMKLTSEEVYVAQMKLVDGWVKNGEMSEKNAERLRESLRVYGEIRSDTEKTNAALDKVNDALNKTKSIGKMDISVTPKGMEKWDDYLKKLTEARDVVGMTTRELAKYKAEQAGANQIQAETASIVSAQEQAYKDLEQAIRNKDKKAIEAAQKNIRQLDIEQQKVALLAEQMATIMQVAENFRKQGVSADIQAGIYRSINEYYGKRQIDLLNGKGEQSQESNDKVAQIQKNTLASMASGGSRSGGGGKSESEIQSLTKSLQEQIAVWGKSDAEIQKYKISLMQGSQAEKDYAMSLVDKISRHKEEQEALKQSRLMADELEAFSRQEMLDITTMGMGDKARAQLEKEYQIRMDFAQKRRELEEMQESESTRISSEAFTQRIDALRQQEEQMLNIVRESAASRAEEEKNIWLGLTEGLKNYADEAGNVYKNLSSASTNWAQQSTDALVDFVMTGKANFKDLANSIIRDLIRIYIQQQITGLFASALGGLFGGGNITSGVTFGSASTVVPTVPIGRATGGLITGPGTGTSDSIPAMLSNGEYVINAEATRKNYALLEAINSGRLPQYRASGGVVGNPPTVAGGFNRSAGNSVTVNITNKGGQPVTGNAQVSMDSMGNMVVDVMLEDLNKNGRYTQQLKSMMGR